MWIHFDFKCGVESQIKLHKMLRSKITNWISLKLIAHSVLTYHFVDISSSLPFDSLYVCLDIPSIDLPKSRTIELSKAILKQIPKEIESKINDARTSAEINIEALDIKDYELELINGNAPKYYGNAPIPEILHFASKGTEIALEVLSNSKTKNKAWKSDRQIAEYVNMKIQQKLKSQREMQYGFHFVCNPLFILNKIESYLRFILTRTIDGNSQRILDYLYSIEETGNILEAYTAWNDHKLKSQ